jgi:hypothetical protein
MLTPVSLTFFFLALLFNPEDGGSSFLQNIGKYLTDDTASHPRG